MRKRRNYGKEFGTAAAVGAGIIGIFTWLTESGKYESPALQQAVMVLFFAVIGAASGCAAWAIAIFGLEPSLNRLSEKWGQVIFIILFILFLCGYIAVWVSLQDSVRNLFLWTYLHDEPYRYP